jgi:hypothetical protein
LGCERTTRVRVRLVGLPPFYSVSPQAAERHSPSTRGTDSASHSTTINWIMARVSTANVKRPPTNRQEFANALGRSCLSPAAWAGDVSLCGAILVGSRGHLDCPAEGGAERLQLRIRHRLGVEHDLVSGVSGDHFGHDL